MYRAVATLLLGLTSIVVAQTSSSRETKFVEEHTLLADNSESSFAQEQFIGFTQPVVVSSSKPKGFGWKTALAESANFLAIQQGIMFASDKYTREQLTQGKWFKTYMKAVRGNDHWDDGDPFLDNYIGHPMQGAITGYIQIQNDPSGRSLQFENTRRYWKSRMKAMAWNAAYSTQFEIGPFGEASVQKLGSYRYANCVPGCPITNGAGLVDFVITPTVGTGWVVAEDMLDRYVPAKLERRFGNNAWTKLLRCVVNPARSAANILHHKAPWYRASRDGTR